MSYQWHSEYRQIFALEEAFTSIAYDALLPDFMKARRLREVIARMHDIALQGFTESFEKGRDFAELVTFFIDAAFPEGIDLSMNFSAAADSSLRAAAEKSISSAYASLDKAMASPHAGMA